METTSEFRRHWALYLFLLVSGALYAAWSAWQPREVQTWFLETAPLFVILALLTMTHKRMPLTPLAYSLIWWAFILILTGAHYTYEHVPVGEWLQQKFDLQRNYYDRFGHFFQGFIPAIIFRELLLRTSPLTRGRWLTFVVIALCATKSMCYEFAEWWTAVIMGGDAHSFLAMQGDEWDAQQDMLCATVGSAVSLLLLNRTHDNQLRRLDARFEKNAGVKEVLKAKD